MNEVSPTPYDIIAPEPFPYALPYSTLIIALCAVIILTFVYLYWRRPSRAIEYAPVADQVSIAIEHVLADSSHYRYAALHRLLVRYNDELKSKNRESVEGLESLISLFERARYAQKITPDTHQDIHTRLNELKSRLV